MALAEFLLRDLIRCVFCALPCTELEDSTLRVSELEKEYREL